MLFYTLVKSFVTYLLICYANVMKHSAIVGAVTLTKGSVN
jgi:hypothetical protein